MLYMAVGIVLGILLNLLPMWQPESAAGFHPEWFGPLKQIGLIEKSDNLRASKTSLCPVTTTDAVIVLSGNGALLKKHEINNRLFAVGRGGTHFITYEKAGTSLEYYGINGDRFWKLESREYPYLSYNGRLIVLLKSDHSGVRLFDYNGNQVGQKEISGRFATAIAFSDGSDFTGIGFLDGSYFILNGKGEILRQGSTPGSLPVKSMALSGNGAYAALHFGDETRDSVMIAAASGKKSRTFPLGRVHPTRTALHISDDGTVAVLDYNQILIAGRKGKIRAALKITPAKTGMAGLVLAGNFLAAAYTGKDGEARFILASREGTPFLEKSFPQEAYLDVSYREPFILLRGSQNLYCYSLSLKAVP